MKRVSAFIIILTAYLAVSETAKAQFLDASKPDDFFRLGARLGMNMSNVSASGTQFDINHDSWGSGFEAGLVADIAFRDWFAIQPGLFYQSRSNSYTHVLGAGAAQNINIGHTLYYSFNIPVMFSARFNVTDRIRWNVEAGPYLSLGLGHNDTGITVTHLAEERYDNGYFDHHRRNQWGLKAGTGIEFNGHYLIGVHYMAGFGNAWDLDGYNGHNKAWTFTLGYNF